MNLLQIQQKVYRRAKLADSPPPADVTRILDFINLWYRELLASPGMDQCRDTTVPMATIANQKKYGLPQAVSRVRDIYDITNQRRVLPRTMDWLRNVDPGLTAVSAFTENWIPLNGWGAELVELASTGVPLYVVSDNAGDTQAAYVETIRLGGIRAGTTTVTVNGVTRAQLGSLSDHIEVVKFYVATAATGTISLYDAPSNGNLLSQITPGRTQARYYMIQFYPTPSASVTLQVDCQRAIEDLTNPTEEPLWHEDFHHCLVHLAAYEEWVNRDDTRANNELARGMKIVGDLKHYVMTSPDQIHVQRGPKGTPERISRLGGYFPART